MLAWARELLDAMQGLCEMLDYGESARPYATALEQQRAKIDDVERTPSARLLEEMRQTGESFLHLARRMSKLHKDYFLDLYPPNESRLSEFAAAARESREEQRAHRSLRHVGFRHLSRALSRRLTPTARPGGGHLT